MGLLSAVEKGFPLAQFEQRVLGARERERLPDTKLHVQNALIALYVEARLPAGLLKERQEILTLEKSRQDMARLHRLESALLKRVQKIAMKWAMPDGLGYSRAMGDIVDRVNQVTEPDQLDKVQKDLVFVRTMFDIESRCEHLVFDEKLQMQIPPSDPDVRAILMRLQKYLESEVANPVPLNK